MIIILKGTLFILFTINEINTEILKITYIKSISRYALGLYFGSSKQLLNQPINQEYGITIVNSNGLNLKNSNSGEHVQNKKMTINAVKTDISEYKDIIEILPINTNTKRIEKYNFYYYKNIIFNTSHIQPGFAFAFKYDSISNSIVHGLYKEKLIDYASYTISPLNPDEGSIIFGLQFSKIEGEKYKYNGEGKVDKHRSTWGGTMKAVGFEGVEKRYLQHSYLYFQAAESYISAPRSFMKYGNETIFEPYLKNYTCNYYVSSATDFILCKCSCIKYFPKVIWLVFGEYKYYLNFQDLFVQGGVTCDFKIVAKELFQSRDSDNNWSFGTVFLDNFTSTFDYEREEIFLSSDQNEIIFLGGEQIDFGNDKVNVNNIVIIASGIVNLSGMVLILIIRLYFKNNARIY